VAIFVLVLWLATAGAGATLLWAGGSARHARADPALADPDPADPLLADPLLADPLLSDPPLSDPLLAGSLLAEPVLADSALGRQLQAKPAHIGAVPLRPDGRPPPGPHVHVATPTGEHPLLEFSHPTLAVTGIACWMMFAFIHYRPLAWIAFAILLVTLLLGLGWFVRNRQAARQHARAAWPFPRRLVLTHGLVAGLSIVLSVLTALTASRG
jgi:hypothetical protein